MRTAIVTGGNRGLGKATAQKLARRGMSVILTARDATQGDAAVFAIRRETRSTDVDWMPLDLASPESIRSFAEWFCLRKVALDVLVNNAGVMPTDPQPRHTEEGRELTFATNVLGPFLLTRLLFPAIVRSASARIVNVSSRMHMPGSHGANVHFDFDDLDARKSYDPMRAYKNSKLALIWFTYELDRRLGNRKIRANAVCPGFVPATVARHTQGFRRLIMQYALPLIPGARSIDEATETIVMVATDPRLEGVGGKFFADRKAIRSSNESYDLDKAQRLWRVACNMLGIDDWPDGRRARLSPSTGDEETGDRNSQPEAG